MTRAQGEAFLAGLVEAFHDRDLERLAAGWCEDIVIRFADLPEVRGREAARKWLAGRFARQRGYSLRKTLMAIDGEVLGDMWTGTWTDAETGAAMAGKGMEFLTMRDGRIAVWEAVFNVWQQGAGGKVPVL